jgi:hypothetical protein
MKHRITIALTASALLTACTTSPYDFPVPVLVDGKEATSMTGYMATDDEAVVRKRLAQRMGCPGHAEFLSLVTRRADNAVGTHILHYNAVMRCEVNDS